MNGLLSVMKWVLVAIGVASCLAQAFRLVAEKTATKKDDEIADGIDKFLAVIKSFAEKATPLTDALALNPKGK